MRCLWFAVLLFTVPFLSGCELIGDIFKAGMAVGVFIIILVLAGIGYLVSRFRK